MKTLRPSDGFPPADGEAASCRSDTRSRGDASWVREPAEETIKGSAGRCRGRHQDKYYALVPNLRLCLLKGEMRTALSILCVGLISMNIEQPTR